MEVHADDPATFCCENALPPIAGLYNFWATLTTIPMLLMPLTALRHAFRQEAPSHLLLWLLCLMLLFVGGTVQHAVGESDGLLNVLNPVALSNSQNALLAGSLAGVPMPLSAAVAAVPAVGAVVLPGAKQKALYETLEAVISPYVIGTMGYRSWSDPRSRRLFLGALVSFAAVHSCMSLERWLCGLPGAELWHATAIHAALVCMFGHVAALALRLSEAERCRHREAREDCKKL